jgi:Cu-Zn family superoxide dismutase
MVTTIRAICVLKPDKGKEGVEGIVHFEQPFNEQKVLVRGKITGLSPGKHGFHVHQFGDLSEGCTSNGPHLNPHQKLHGAPTAAERHVGDLGNIEANNAGVAEINIEDTIISLKPGGPNSIIG